MGVLTALVDGGEVLAMADGGELAFHQSSASLDVEEIMIKGPIQITPNDAVVVHDASSGLGAGLAEAEIADLLSRAGAARRGSASWRRTSGEGSSLPIRPSSQREEWVASLHSFLQNDVNLRSGPLDRCVKIWSKTRSILPRSD